MGLSASGATKARATAMMPPRAPIISVSAGAQDDDKQLLYQLGIHHFVEKGTQLKERLSAAIYDAMGIDKRTERPTQF